MKIISSLNIILLSSLYINAQEFDAQISKAKSAYSAGNYEESRFAVQNALHEIDVQIGKDVLAALPAKIDNMEHVPESDQVTGSGSTYVGLFIERSWGSTDDESINFSLISDSPLMSAVNAFLALPTMMVSSDSNQKKIKVEGYKALLERKVNEETNKVSGYSLQLPYSNALMQVDYQGEISEEGFLSLVSEIPVSKITKIAR